MVDTQLKQKKVVIVGAGIGGLAAAIALREKLGYNDFIIYEKGHDVGGTWRENTYPGCACDVPSHWYSLSTDWNPSWSKVYSSQPEILAYLQDVTKRRDLASRIKFGYKLTSGVWDEAKGRYAMTFDVLDKEGKTVGTSEDSAEVLISAIGGLHVPAFPNIPGLDTFSGSLWHAALWRHDIPLAGKRVGIIGNGCSGAQIVPAISEDPTVQVTNFCRTPSWFVPRNNYNLSRFNWIFRYIPFMAALYRFWIYITSDLRYLAWTERGKFLRKLAARASRAYIRSQAPKELHEKLIPQYDFGCKRIIVDPGYLKSLNRPNVTTEWDPIECVVPEGVKLASGKIIGLDILVPATGFDVVGTAPPLRGVNGTTVLEYFKSKGGPTAYRGTTVPGFPNVFQILGPNVASGHGSAIFVMETQINYAIKLIRPILSGSITSVEPRDDATDRYNEGLQEKLGRTAWSGCYSYYNQQGGKNVAMFPGTLFSFWRQMRNPIWDDYHVVKPLSNGSSVANGNGNGKKLD